MREGQRQGRTRGEQVRRSAVTRRWMCVLSFSSGNTGLTVGEPVLECLRHGAGGVSGELGVG